MPARSDARGADHRTLGEDLRIQLVSRVRLRLPNLSDLVARGNRQELEFEGTESTPTLVALRPVARLTCETLPSATEAKLPGSLERAFRPFAHACQELPPQILRTFFRSAAEAVWNELPRE
jgi:hypothetical protein